MLDLPQCPITCLLKSVEDLVPSFCDFQLKGLPKGLTTFLLLLRSNCCFMLCPLMLSAVWPCSSSLLQCWSFQGSGRTSEAQPCGTVSMYTAFVHGSHIFLLWPPSFLDWPLTLRLVLMWLSYFVGWPFLWPQSFCDWSPSFMTRPLSWLRKHDRT